MPDESLWKVLGSRLEARKAVILGIGNPWRGDDAFGPALAKRLQGIVRATVINAEEVPENFLGLIVAADPETVVLVDAVELGLAPGEIALVEADALGGPSVSTHTASLSLCARYLGGETKADVFLLGVQPLTRELGVSLSAPVSAALDLLSAILLELLPRGSPSDTRRSQRDDLPSVPSSESPDNP